MLTSSVVVFAGALLTGLGVYDRIGSFMRMRQRAYHRVCQFGGIPAMGTSGRVCAGASVPRCSVAGPVIVYATLTATIVSIIKLYVF